MKQLKVVLISVVIGGLLGLWFGVNIGKQNPILSNPFAESTLQQQLQEKRDELRRRSADAIRGD